MASERAKALAAKQKAEAKAEKLRKKQSNDPKDWGYFRQIKETYKITAQFDKALPWWLGGAFVGSIVVFLVLGFVLRSPIIWGLLGVSVGLLLASLILLQRAKRAAYKRYEGQAGSAEVALGMLNKKWIASPAIAATRNRNSADVVHRALGPGGLILIGEGSPKHLKPLLASEKRRHEQVAYGVDVIVIQMGKGGGQVPLDKLAAHIQKLPKKLSKAKIAEVETRLKALDAMRPTMPIPKGPISMKGAHRAMRGR